MSKLQKVYIVILHIFAIGGIGSYLGHYLSSQGDWQHLQWTHTRYSGGQIPQFERLTSSSTVIHSAQLMDSEIIRIVENEDDLVSILIYPPDSLSTWIFEPASSSITAESWSVLIDNYETTSDREASEPLYSLFDSNGDGIPERGIWWDEEKQIFSGVDIWKQMFERIEKNH